MKPLQILTMKYTLWIHLIIIIFISQVHAITIEDIAKLNPSDKIEFYKNLSRESFSDPEDIYFALAEGLRDDETQVRRICAAKSLLIITSIQKYVQESDSPRMPSPKILALKEALKKAVDDPNLRVRGAALSALTYSDEPNQLYEKIILDRIEMESNKKIALTVLRDMYSSGYRSPDIGIYAIKALSDVTPSVREDAARAIVEIRPFGALPSLVKLLSDEGTVVSAVVQAIGAYGTEALPYVPALEKLLADRSIGGTLPDQIRAALNAIKNPSQQPPAKPRLKAVSLINKNSPSETKAEPQAEASPNAQKVLVTPTQNASADLKSSAPESTQPLAAQSNNVRWWIIGLIAVAGGLFFILHRSKR